MERAKRQRAVEDLLTDGLSPRQIAANLCVPEATIYADLRRLRLYTPRSVLVAERRARVLALYENGKSQPEIAETLGMPRANVALDLKSSNGYAVRGGAREGWMLASAAARVHGVNLWTLCAAIDAGRVRGCSESLSAWRTVRYVRPEEIAADLANLPVCHEPGCDRVALAPSGYCSGAHAQAAETRGTKRPGETCRRIAEGKRGKPRPDVRDRVAAMHADPRTKRAWGVRFVEGRKASPTSSISARSLSKWKGRNASLPGERRGGKKPIEQTMPRHVLESVTRLRDKGHSIREIVAYAPAWFALVNAAGSLMIDGDRPAAFSDEAAASTAANSSGWIPQKRRLTKRQIEGILARRKLSP